MIRKRGGSAWNSHALISGTLGSALCPQGSNAPRRRVARASVMGAVIILGLGRELISERPGTRSCLVTWASTGLPYRGFSYKPLVPIGKDQGNPRGPSGHY